jgi:hypothetical protein
MLVPSLDSMEAGLRGVLEESLEGATFVNEPHGFADTVERDIFAR